MKLRPYPPEVQALLEAERDYPPEPPARRARVLAAMTATLASSLPTAAHGAGSAIGATGGAGSAAGSAASGLARLVSATLVAFVAGAGAGAGTYHALTSAREAPPPAGLREDLPAQTSKPAASPDAGVATPTLVGPEPAATPEATPAEAARPRPRGPREPSTRGAAPRSDREERARERQLIEVARAAVARGNSAAALDALRRHAQQFPRGRLSEEREALRVLALASAGQSAAARHRAAAFHRSHPNSVFGPAVDRALAGGRGTEESIPP